jgi:hypothetical protein
MHAAIVPLLMYRRLLFGVWMTAAGCQDKWPSRQLSCAVRNGAELCSKNKVNVAAVVYEKPRCEA